MANILVGTCSWSNPGLRGTFYPKEIPGRDMLGFYARHFRLVEVDSTYYHLPSYQSVKLWAARTPDDFVFDVKAYKVLTKHDRTTEPDADTFHSFAAALEPMLTAGKLGVVLFQFPPWFKFSDENLEYIRECKEQTQPYKLAIEFRSGSWLREDTVHQTLQFLRENELAYVSVDEPQFPGSTVPPIAVATSNVAVVRFHGRNRNTWFKRDISVEERFNYLYTEQELAEWVPKIRELAESAQQVHVLMNNCYHDYSVRNARDISRLLGDPGRADGETSPQADSQPRLL
ncbi:MAG: DUF72 domain-containing protein [Dehalococcoidales bacterium]|nr:DUF72 domain-containing protein [Dehalococcoidales bacterium]